MKAGDEVDLRGEGTQPHRVKVAAVTRSLIGAETFISEGLYHRLFPAPQLGEAASRQPAITWNAVYAKLKGGSDEQIKYVDQLEDDAGVHIAWWSYAITVVVTLAVAFLVRLFVNPVLDRIDPVGSLKAVE